MMDVAKVLLSIAASFTALSLVCAVRIGRRPHRPAADPHAYPYADMPGFSREQLEYCAHRPVELHHASCGELPRRSAAGSGLPSSRPLPANLNVRRLFNASAPKPPFGRGRRAF
ncbi:hypothetical protein [Bradyrhizobium elkanii]|uniref:hypothetical protein n=1 Tax=Bradyrhizobium elkanii TaxID=29448 RepID=UPI000841D4D6|nr:hypothetical protein [Bradyrhizobium elkanii]ODM71719.1 hypothetical protein A6X20_07190 [Bradyrhizobium elkanii]ODM79092.1 hypothetical protein A6452_28775 [Bradyrhizobium elkanii]